MAISPIKVYYLGNGKFKVWPEPSDPDEIRSVGYAILHHNDLNENNSDLNENNSDSPSLVAQQTPIEEGTEILF